MHLLFFTPQLPYPPRQGTTIRNYNLIKALAQRHRIDLLTFLAPGEVLTHDNLLYGLCSRVAALPQPQRTLRQRAWSTLLSPLPDMALRLEDMAMHELARQWASESAYDLIQVEGIEMAQFGLKAWHNRAAHPNQQRPALVFDDHNCEYLLQKRNALADLRSPRRWLAAAYSLVQWQKLRWYERMLCRQVDVTLAVSTADKRALHELAPNLRVEVVSNGIDLAEYPAEVTRSSLSPPYQLVFTGKMDYRPNIDAALWFGRHVLPLIQAQESQVRFQIVGMNPHPRLDELRTNPAVEITGAVPDPRSYLAAAAVYVMPLRIGGGTRFKALEAMASGQRIVSTTLGVEGIGVQHERELLLADEAADFARAVVRLLRDGAQGGAYGPQLGDRARQFVEQHYRWEGIIPKLEEVYAITCAMAHGKGRLSKSDNRVRRLRRNN
jgi:sugar transferase (PEP-CTERM/EpsH1 system associated)